MWIYKSGDKYASALGEECSQYYKTIPSPFLLHFFEYVIVEYLQTHYKNYLYMIPRSNGKGKHGVLYGS
jgi:hypothetical protein